VFRFAPCTMTAIGASVPPTSAIDVVRVRGDGARVRASCLPAFSAKMLFCPPHSCGRCPARGRRLDAEAIEIGVHGVAVDFGVGPPVVASGT